MLRETTRFSMQQVLLFHATSHFCGFTNIVYVRQNLLLVARSCLLRDVCCRTELFVKFHLLHGIVALTCFVARLCLLLVIVVILELFVI